MLFQIKPPDLAFSGNPVRYKIDVSDGGGTAAPDYSVNTITFTDIDTTEDHDVSVTLLGEPVSFTLKAAPDGPTEIPAAESGMTVLAWATSIYERLQRNSTLMLNYDITFDDSLLVITLTAKEYGALYDITAGTNNITGMSLDTTVGGSSGSAPVDGVMLWVFDKNNVVIGQDYKPLNSTNYVDFDIAEYLKVALSSLTHPLFHLSPGAQLIYQFNPDFILKYRVGAAYVTDGVIGTMIYDFYHYAITGGLSRAAQNYWNAISGGFWYNSANNSRFMTWLPGTKKTFKDSKELLYFAVQDLTLTKISLNVSYTCTDGTTGSFVAYELTTSTKYQVIECDCGYKELGLDSVAVGKEVSAWSVHLKNNSAQTISEIRYFEINDNYYEFTRSFVFKNSYGVFETITFTGKGSDKKTYERESVSYISNQVETSFNVPDRNSQVLQRSTYSVNTGWISSAMYDYMSDFFKALEIYQIVGDNLFRIRITGKSNKTGARRWSV